MGGILSSDDALEFIMAGASAIAIGTGQFVNPHCCLDVRAGLEKYCRENEIENIMELKGAAWK
jgi:dihydroorotate dehydrogenase (NAD+) catalytic subunit